MANWQRMSNVIVRMKMCRVSTFAHSFVSKQRAWTSVHTDGSWRTPASLQKADSVRGVVTSLCLFQGGARPTVYVRKFMPGRCDWYPSLTEGHGTLWAAAFWPPCVEWGWETTSITEVNRVFLNLHQEKGVYAKDRAWKRTDIYHVSHRVVIQPRLGLA